MDYKKLDTAKFLYIFLIVTLNNILILDQDHDLKITVKTPLRNRHMGGPLTKIRFMFKFYCALFR